MISPHGTGPQDTARPTIRVLILADDPAIRRGLVIRLDAEPDIIVVGTAAVAGHIEEVRDQPSVAVLAVRRVDSTVRTVASTLRRADHAPAVVLLVLDGAAGGLGGLPMVSMHDSDEALLRAIRQCSPSDASIVR